MKLVCLLDVPGLAANVTLRDCRTFDDNLSNKQQSEANHEAKARMALIDTLAAHSIFISTNGY